MPSLPEPLDLRDPQAFTACYRAFAPAALATATSILRDSAAAEDVVQEVFTTLWSRPEMYDSERGALGALVRVMARSRSLDRLRSRGVADLAAHRVGREVQAGSASAESTEETVIRRDAGRAVLRQLERQAPAQREAVLLHHVAGLSDREVAAATCVPLGTAKSRIRLGLRHAADALAA
jgi:RNA polymerase sigma-70 factor (ECF subfamily)